MGKKIATRYSEGYFPESISAKYLTLHCVSYTIIWGAFRHFIKDTLKSPCDFIFSSSYNSRKSFLYIETRIWQTCHDVEIYDRSLLVRINAEV